MNEQATKSGSSGGQAATGTRADSVGTPATERESDQPLQGIRIVELHAIGPVPFAGQLARTLGAEVIRVSPPHDPGLGVGVKPEFDVLNTGKRPFLVDLKSNEGLDSLQELLGGADVLLEGFRPGVLERLQLAPDRLLERHPRLIIGRLSGWGRAGMLAPRAGHDINYLALTGILNAIGDADRPMPPLNLVADFGGGAMHLLVGVLARLVRRGVTGRGGLVETSILAGSVGLTGMFYGLLANGTWSLTRGANLLDGGAPYYRTYRCSDGRFVAVGALERKFYATLLEVTGLIDEIDVAAQHRIETWPDTAARLAQRFAQRSRDEWAQAAEGFDACLSPVLDFEEAALHPHNLANGLYTEGPFARPAKVIGFG